MDELLRQFLNEGPELVQQGSDALLALERKPDDRTMLDDALRAIHTLKGSVGLFDLAPMESTLHAAEDALQAVREGRSAVDPETIDRLLAVLTQTEKWLHALEHGGGLPADAAAVAERLTSRLATRPDRAAEPLVPPDTTPSWVEHLSAALPSSVTGAISAIRYVPDAGCYFSGDDPIKIVAGVPGLVHLQLGLRPVDNPDAAYDPFTCRLVIEAASSAALDEVKPCFRFVPDQVAFATLTVGRTTEGTEPGQEAGTRTLRINAERIEALAGLVDELVAAKNGLAGTAAQAKAGGDAAAVARDLVAQQGELDRLVGQLHRRVMALRMVPVAPLLRRFPRIVREMAAALGKDVDLVIEGGTVEADKTVVEGLFEPLTHLLRNAVDHGVETRAARVAQGKPARAAISVTAREAGGQLHLHVEDDGSGIDPERIRAAVLRRSLMDAERLRGLSDQETIELVFLPGFSTADAVTSLSGRGVGMDAVRTAVGRLGGRIAIASAVGKGTKVDIVLPLTVALTKVMVVSDAGERYGVPMDRVLETVRVSAGQIVAIRAGYAFNWRDKTVPLLKLSALTGIGTEGASLDGRDQKVLVVRTGDGFAGLAIGAIDDRLDVAMRPLDGLLAGMRGLVGTTALADGRVLLILDPETLVQ